MDVDFVFRPLAEEELDEILAWYEIQKEGLGISFLESADEALNRIQEYPLHFPVVHKEIRKSSVKNFPFNIYFRVNKKQIVILGFIHQKRNPSLWKKRN